MSERRQELVLTAIGFDQRFLQAFTPGEVDADAENTSHFVVGFTHDATTIGNPENASVRSHCPIFDLEVASFHCPFEGSVERGHVVRMDRMRNTAVRAKRAFWKSEHNFGVRG